MFSTEFSTQKKEMTYFIKKMCAPLGCRITIALKCQEIRQN